MARYSIFTEYNKDKIDFNELRNKLGALELKIIGEECGNNSVVVKYDGNIKEFREKIDGIIKGIKRNGVAIYVDANNEQRLKIT